MTEENKKAIHSSFWANTFHTPTESDELIHVLQAIPLFKSLTKKEVSGLLGIIHNRIYIAGEYIFYQGDPGIGLYIIRDGEVLISRESEKKDKITLAVFQKGDFFGELALLTQAPRAADVIALAFCEVLVMTAGDFASLLARNPDLQTQVAETATVRLGRN